MIDMPGLLDNPEILSGLLTIMAARQGKDPTQAILLAQKMRQDAEDRKDKMAQQEWTRKYQQMQMDKMQADLSASQAQRDAAPDMVRGLLGVQEGPLQPGQQAMVDYAGADPAIVGGLLQARMKNQFDDTKRAQELSDKMALERYKHDLGGGAKSYNLQTQAQNQGGKLVTIDFDPRTGSRTIAATGEPVDYSKGPIINLPTLTSADKNELTYDQARKEAQYRIVSGNLADLDSLLKSGDVDLTRLSGLWKEYITRPELASQVAASIAGKLQDFTGWNITPTADEAKALSFFRKIEVELLHAMRGAQVGPREQTLYRQNLPQPGQDEETLRANMQITMGNLSKLYSIAEGLRGTSKYSAGTSAGGAMTATERGEQLLQQGFSDKDIEDTLRKEGYIP